MGELLKVENQEERRSPDEVFLASLRDAASTPEAIDVAQALEAEAASLGFQADALVDAAIAAPDENDERAKGINAKIRATRNALHRKLQQFSAAGAFGSALIALHLKEPLAPEEPFSQMKERAKQEMQERGITRDQSQAYTKGVNDILYRNIVPLAYFERDNGSFSGRIDGILTMIARFLEGLREREKATPEREDAWRFYLGMPQENDTFGISDFQPSRSKDNKYYYKITNMESYLATTVFLPTKSKAGALRKIVSSIEDGNGVFLSIHSVMGYFQWTKGEDVRGHYIAYYDRWDLDVPLERGEGFFGQPFEIYDRIYYDPVTFEVIESVR